MANPFGALAVGTAAVGVVLRGNLDDGTCSIRDPSAVVNGRVRRAPRGTCNAAFGPAPLVFGSQEEGIDRMLCEQRR